MKLYDCNFLFQHLGNVFYIFSSGTSEVSIGLKSGKVVTTV